MRSVPRVGLLQRHTFHSSHLRTACSAIIFSMHDRLMAAQPARMHQGSIRPARYSICQHLNSSQTAACVHAAECGGRGAGHRSGTSSTCWAQMRASCSTWCPCWSPSIVHASLLTMPSGHAECRMFKSRHWQAHLAPEISPLVGSRPWHQI